MSTDMYPNGAPSINSINDDVQTTQKAVHLPGVVIHVDHKVDKGETCCRSCCYGVYSFFSTLFCFKKDQSLMSKLGITWFWTLFIPLSIGLVLGFYVFAPYNFVSSPGDQRDVMGDYDSFFCDGIKLDSSQGFDAYLLGKSPEIMQSNRSYNTFEMKNITINPDSFITWNFYLLEGSIVQFEICNEKELEFFMLEGKHNYDRWKKNPINCKCFMEYLSFEHGSPQCADQDSANHSSTDDKISTYNFTTSISNTDEYYLVFQNPSNLNPNEMNLNLQINRSTYNLKDNVKDICTNLSSCNFSLGFLSSETVVYVSIQETMFNIDTRLYCNPTWAVYFTLFGGVPMIAGFCISLLFFILFMHCQNAWEGVYRPKPWDDEVKANNTKKSILDTLPDDTKKKDENEKQNEQKKNSKGKLFGKKSGYDTLSEEETDEESMETLPRRSPPPSYSAGAAAEPSGDQPPSATKEPEEMNGVVLVEVHAAPQ